jgi:CDP-diacylglycerol--serine O-phosphatidyltransferase
MPKGQMLRYLAPNLITALALVFGLLSIAAAFEGRYVDAGWWIIYAVVSDRADGLVARMLKGTSELGVQLDSLADFMNFGLAPAILVFAALGENEALGFQDGGQRLLLMAGCAVWVLGATFRLARFNLDAEPEEPGVPKPKGPKIFFGIPTTLAAGLLVMWLLTFLKYAPASGQGFDSRGSSGAMLFGDLMTPLGVWRAFPVVMALGGLAMASNLRIPKLGKSRSKAFMGFIVLNLLVGIPLSFARLFPEITIWQPTMWVVVFLVWGMLSKEAQAMQPPAIFKDRPPPPAPDELLD